MGRLWSDQARYERWLDVELAALDAWEAIGRRPGRHGGGVPRDAHGRRRRIAELDAQVSHETAAFVSQVQETCGEEGRFIHYGLTSYDVVDTAQGMAMRDALQLHRRPAARADLRAEATGARAPRHDLHGSQPRHPRRADDVRREARRVRLRVRPAQRAAARGPAAASSIGTVSGPIGTLRERPAGGRGAA